MGHIIKRNRHLILQVIMKRKILGKNKRRVQKEGGHSLQWISNLGELFSVYQTIYYGSCHKAANIMMLINSRRRRRISHMAQ